MESSASNANNDNVPVAKEWPLPSQWHTQLEEEEGFIDTKTWRRTAAGSNEIVTKPGLKSLALVQAAKNGVSVLDWQSNGSRPGTISVLEGLAHIASNVLEHGSPSCSNILFGTGGDITITGGEVPGDGVVRPATLAGHKSLGEHNNGADAEIHQR
ncbi:hypothetical protein V490_09108 [Pseudogymnoascus sp. VKM F-3557]|nr:hypothetical protein V490_09108 [Pseudogymnoascus sp. VKM F-3557]